MNKYQIYKDEDMELEVFTGRLNSVGFTLSPIDSSEVTVLELESIDDIERLYEQLGTWISYHKV